MLIKNIWKNTTFFCDEDGSELELQQINNYVFYSCPKCHAKLNTTHAEKCIDKLCEFETERQVKSIEVNFKGKKFNIADKYTFCVKEEGDGKWKISVKVLH